MDEHSMKDAWLSEYGSRSRSSHVHVHEDSVTQYTGNDQGGL